MSVSSVEVISVPVADQDRAKHFYADVLGFAAEMDSSFGENMRWVMLRPPGGGTAITLVTWFESMPPGSLNGTVLGCQDLDAAVSELSVKGLSFAEDQTQEAPWGRWRTFTDPDGNGWVLQQSTPHVG